MNPVTIFFPKTAAASVQARVHGEAAFHFAREAAKAPDKATRLDAAVRAMDRFDHAVTASRKLPLGAVVSNIGLYYAGYDAAKLAVELILRSNAVPAARERVGRAEVAQAHEHFHAGLAQYAAEGKSRYGRYRATDWLDASLEDSASGLAMLRKPEIAKPLLQGLADTRATILAKRQISDDRVRAIDALFRQASASFDTLIDAASVQPVAA